MSETQSETAIKQRCCQGCHEWIDARARECYICGTPAPEFNNALHRANETSRMNGALQSQMRELSGEIQTSRMVPNNPSGQGPTQLYPGAGRVAAEIKQQLRDAGAFD